MKNVNPVALTITLTECSCTVKYHKKIMSN